MLIEKFEQQAKQFNHNTAVKVANETITYGELNAMANGTAAEIETLRHRLNGCVQVGLLFEHGSGMIAALLGVLKAGMVYVPMDVSYPEKRLLYMLENSEAGLIMTNTVNLPLAEHLVRESGNSIALLNIDTIDNGIDVPNPSREIRREQPAYILYTSGSTGTPKGVVQNHRNIVYFSETWKRAFSVTPSDRMTLLSVFSHDAAVMDIFGALLNGAALYPYDIRNAAAGTGPARFLVEEKITIWHSVPTLYRYFADSLTGEKTFPLLRYIILGGEAVRAHDIALFNRFFPHSSFVNLYGQTESSISSVCVIPPGRAVDKPVIGDPPEGTDILLVDEEDELVEGLGVGEIVVAGDHLALGYWKDPEKTGDVFTDDPELGRLYWTGDLGGSLGDGRIEMLGRKDFQAKIRGFRVEMGEIETALLAHHAVKEAAAVIKDGKNGESLLCSYVTTEGDVHVSELREYLMGELPDYMVPSHFTTLETMPLTSTGKTDRNALPEPQTGEMDEPYAAPRNEIEEILVQTWIDVLGAAKEEIGIDSDFFQLGGHSLKAVTVTLKIHKALDVRIQLPEFFARPTVRKLAEYIERARKDKYESIEKVEKKEYYPLSPAQKRLYILQQMETRNTGYHLPVFVVLEGLLSVEKVEETFRTLIRRHESLRTSFFMINGEPVQRIHEPRHIEFSVKSSVTPLPLIHEFIRPFDLSEAPIFRAGLVRLEENKHLLMMDIHHIVTDGTSQGLFVEDFMAVYEGRQLERLPIRYADYAVWQNSPEQRRVMQEQEAYWLEVFSGPIPVLDLPLDFPRPPVQSFEGSGVVFEVESAGTAGLKKLAQDNNVTLYMVLFALYNIFLSRLSGGEDIIVGTPTAGRGRVELQRIIGMFVNTLALRNFPCSDKTVTSFINEVGDHALRAFENQDYPFEELVEKVAVEKDPGRNPLFDTVFALQNMDVPEVEIPGLRLSPYDVEDRTSKFDLSLMGFEAGDKLFFRFEYCTRLFKGETLQRFTGYFKQLVSSVLEQPDAVIGALDIMSPEERRRVLVDFNGAVRDYPRDKTIHQLFEEQAAQSPDGVALVGTTHRTNGTNRTYRSYETQLTYSQLNDDAGRLAVVLRDKGVGPDAVVGLMVERSVEMIVGVLAVLKAGGAYMPIDPDFPEERKTFMMEDSSAKLLLTTDDIAAARQSVPATRNPQPAASPGNPAYVIYTSGTTGRPKGVVIEHRQVVAYNDATTAIRPMSHRDVKTQAFPFSFDPFGEEVYPILTTGGRLVLVSKDDTRNSVELVSIIRRHQVTVFSTTPAMLNEVNKFPLPGHLAQVLVGGEALKRDYISNIAGKIAVYNYYGPTEATIAATWYLCPAAAEMGGTIPIGKPLPNSNVYILDRNGNPCPIGVYGELYISGNSVGRGYLNRPELTAERFIDLNRTYKSYRSYGSYLSKEKLYKTGDLARWLPDGNIEFLGRIDNQVKIRGFRIELGEIESQLVTHEQVKEAVVTARPDRNGEKYLCAYLICEEDLDMSGLRTMLSGKLPAYMVPSCFVPMETFPLTSHRKIDRNALPDPLIRDGSGNRRAPENEIEEKLLDIWAEILGMEKEHISMDDDFFQLGGHSLKAVRVVNAVHKALGKKIEIHYLFRFPTIEQLGVRISEDEVTPFEEIEALPVRDYYELSYTQKRMWVLQKLNPGSAAFNLPFVTLLGAETDGSMVEEVLQQLVRRHESFRTYFKEMGDEVVQVVLPPEPGVRVNLEFIDWSHLGEAEQVKQTGRLTAGENVPIDMQTPPLFRAKLVKISAESYILYINMHHIISDGWSVDVLEREFHLLYEARRTGREISLEPLRIQYKDYAARHNRLLADEDGINRARACWKEQLSGELPVLQLPFDFSPGAEFEKNSAGYRAALSAGVTAKLREIAVNENTSLFMVLLSGFYLLLSFLGRQKDIVIGIPGAARFHEDLKNIIGLFVNTLILRNGVQPDEAFSDFLAGVRQNTLKVLEYQSYPMELICEELKIKYPDLNVFFNMVNTGSGGLEELADFQARHTETSQDTKFPLTFYVTEFSNGIDITCNYFTGLFKPGTVERIMAIYLRILGNIAEDPSKPVGQYHKSAKKRRLKRG
jgi:amino acid adenylation domain-containing protein